MKKARVDLEDGFLPASTAEKIGLTSRSLIPGMISLYEEHAIRVDAGYKLKEWYQLDPLERAFEVAIRRTTGLIERHILEASK